MSESRIRGEAALPTGVCLMGKERHFLSIWLSSMRNAHLGEILMHLVLFVNVFELLSTCIFTDFVVHCVPFFMIY